MKVGYVTNSSEYSGVGHRAKQIADRLPPQQVDSSKIYLDAESAGIRPWPGVLGSKSVNWVRLGRQVKSELDLYHLTNQTLSFMAKRLPAVVTVHDIIEVTEPQDKKAYLLNKYLYSGIKRAAHVIAVSQYTAKMVQDFYGVANEKMTVIYNGVGEDFRPIENFDQTLGFQELRRELRLPADSKVVLYVGSDHSRKNAIGAVQAAARARLQNNNVIFIKVGNPGLAAGRAALLDEIDKLKMREAVRFVGNVSLNRLNELYNLADVLIYPSKFEGFGLPPLQAMAAGTPVITTNATSLPEVVGDAALQHDPDDIAGMAEDILALLNDQQLAESLSGKGLARAQKFSWEEAAKKVASVYRLVIPKK